MASTNDIIKQLEHEIELRRVEISTFHSIISQLKGKPGSFSNEIIGEVKNQPIKRAGRGRPKRVVQVVSEDVSVAEEEIASETSGVSKGSGKVGRPKMRKRAKGTVVDSVIRFLKRRKQFCESETIFRSIKSKHKDKSSEEFYRYLTVTLSNLKRRGELVSVKQDENGVKLNRNYWGLNRWVTKEGNIKPAYYFGQAAVQETLFEE